MSRPAPRFKQVAAAPIEASEEELIRLSDSMGVPALIRPPSQAAEPPAPPTLVSSRVENDDPTPAPAEPSSASDSGDEAQPHQHFAVFEPMKTDTERLTVEIPLYVGDQLRRKAFENRFSTRYIIMSALKASGFDVKIEDLNPNRRRFKLSQ